MRFLAKLLLVGIILIPFVLLGGACERTITTVEETVQPNTCFECHSDANTELIAAHQQWSNSLHASGANIHRVSRGCENCHTSEGFVARISGGASGAIDNPTVIHCFTCHAPHTRGDLSLRVTTPQMLADGTMFDLGSANLCTACHQARRDVNTYVAQDTVELSEHWGPHYSPQSDMVIATNGYEYSWYSYDRSVSHRGGTEDGCLDCHFKTTENNILGGHSFNMTFTELGEGGPEESENTNGCNVSVCHDGDVDDFDHADVQTDVEALSDSLRTILFNAGLIDDTGHPLDDLFVASLSEPGDSVGAVWNYLITHEDRSHGIHNPKYVLGLLESSIQFMETGPPPSPFAAMKRKLGDK
jgi:hypothetical protein